MVTDDEAISNINVIKSIRNMKKGPNCFSIRDYISKLLSNSNITERILQY